MSRGKGEIKRESVSNLRILPVDEADKQKPQRIEVRCPLCVSPAVALATAVIRLVWCEQGHVTIDFGNKILNLYDFSKHSNG